LLQFRGVSQLVNGSAGRLRRTPGLGDFIKEWPGKLEVRRVEVGSKLQRARVSALWLGLQLQSNLTVRIGYLVMRFSHARLPPKPGPDPSAVLCETALIANTILQNAEDIAVRHTIALVARVIHERGGYMRCGYLHVFVVEQAAECGFCLFEVLPN